MSGRFLAIAAAVGVLLAPGAGLAAIALLISPVLLTCAPLPPADPGGPATVPETLAVVLPVPAGTYNITDRFGMRDDPFTGERRMHYGTDFAADDGTPILAAADGVVRIAGHTPGWGPLIVIDHTVDARPVDARPVATLYLHMWPHGIYVAPGQHVAAGQMIGEVGSAGRSTGPHLHFEVRQGGWPGTPVDSLRWLTDHDALSLDEAGINGCRPPEADPNSNPGSGGGMSRNVYPDFGAAGGAGLAEMLGALMTVVLVVAVLMIVACAAAWAIAHGAGNWHASSRARAGLLVALGGAAIAGALVAWANFLIGVGAGV